MKRDSLRIRIVIAGRQRKVRVLSVRTFHGGEQINWYVGLSRVSRRDLDLQLFHRHISSPAPSPATEYGVQVMFEYNLC